MERLWAPWRMAYIKSASELSEGCLFCRITAEANDEENLILYRGKLAFVMLNKFPYTNGHMMVVPYRHIAAMNLLSQEEHIELGRLLAAACDALSNTAKPQGFNIGMNLGRIAGAGIADHLHYHVVPRWAGDTNFMPVLSDTRVISDSLEAAYYDLKPQFEQLNHR